MIKKNKLALWLLILFVVIMGSITIWQRTVALSSLVKVELTVPSPGKVNPEFTKFGEVLTHKDPKYKMNLKTNIEFSPEEIMGDFYWKKGSNIHVSLPGISADLIEAQVHSIKVSDQGSTVDIVFYSPVAKPGDSVKVHFRTDSFDFRENVVGRQVIKKDYIGYYIMIVERRDGPWGKEFYAKKEYVNILAADLKYAAISGFKAGYPVIKHADEPVQDGQRVTFYP